MVASKDQDPDLAGRDIVDLLHERHAQTRDAFAAVIAAEGPVKAALFDELVTSLAAREVVARELIRPLVERQGPVSSAVCTGPAGETEVMTHLSRLTGTSRATTSSRADRGGPNRDLAHGCAPARRRLGAGTAMGQAIPGSGSGPWTSHVPIVSSALGMAFRALGTVGTDMRR
jgi:hypothetical protein